jgi:hypothetical protein
MNRIGRARHLRRIPAASLMLALLASAVPLAAVSAAVMVTPNAYSISADTAAAPPGTGTYTTVTVTVAEGAAGDLTNGTIVLNAPAGFEFNTATGNQGAALAAPCGTTAVSFVASATPTITVTNAPSATPCTITITLEVRPTVGDPLATGTITNSSASAGAPMPGNYGTLTEVNGAPDSAQTAFTQQPSGTATGGTPFAQQPIVTVKDRFGHVLDNQQVTLARTPGTGAGTGTLTCDNNTLATTGSGQAAFTGCRIDVASNGYTLRATVGAATVDSTPINVTVGPATRMQFAAYPASTTPSLLSPQPAVRVLDAGGNVVNDGRTITLLINQNEATFTCSGGRSLAASAGLAQFVGCTQTTVGSGYFITATSAGLPNVVGDTFTVTAGPAKLAVCWNSVSPCGPTPTAIAGGSQFTLNVLIEDASGAVVTSDNTTSVTVALVPGTPKSGGPGVLNCSPGATTKAVNGIASFSCVVPNLGNGYQIQATSSPALTAATSGVFDVGVGAPVKLAFVKDPLPTGKDQPFTPDLQVAVVDAGGNVRFRDITATIRLSLGRNPSSATLTCTGGLEATTVDGIATFHGCSIDKEGTEFTIVATAVSTTPPTTLAPAQTGSITIGPAGAKLSVTPSSTVITWGGGVTLKVHFTDGGAGRSVVLQVSRDQATWSPIATLTTNATGDASFDYRPSDNRYYRATFAGAADISAGQSSPARVVVRQIALLTPTPIAKGRTVKLGTEVIFRTLVRPARADLPAAPVRYVVYGLQNGKWVQLLVRDLVSDPAGKTSLTLTFTGTGKFYVRSIAQPTALNANSVWSPINLYLVK